MKAVLFMPAELAYKARIQEAQAALEKLTANVCSQPAEGRVDWGHVDELTQIVIYLEEAAASI